MRRVSVLVSFFATLLSAGPRLGPDDSSAFRRWFTFLAESRYYARKPLRGVSDGDSLIRWAARHALAPHDATWSRSIELPILPAMPSVRESVPLRASLEQQIVSRDIADALPGDLFLYRRAELPAHVMIYIGPSQILPSRKRWVIYLSGNATHKVCIDSLRADPSPEWRPLPENPEFLGIVRLDILQDNAVID